MGLSYSSIKTAWSALSALIACGEGSPFGNNSMKDVFCVRQSLPRYEETWDISIVLNHMRKWYPLNQLGLKQLTLKTLSLMALISMQRSQTLQALEIGKNLIMVSDPCTYKIKTLLKIQDLTNIFEILHSKHIPMMMHCVLFHAQGNTFNEQKCFVENLPSFLLVLLNLIGM